MGGDQRLVVHHRLRGEPQRPETRTSGLAVLSEVEEGGAAGAVGGAPEACGQAQLLREATGSAHPPPLRRRGGGPGPRQRRDTCRLCHTVRGVGTHRVLGREQSRHVTRTAEKKTPQRRIRDLRRWERESTRRCGFAASRRATLTEVCLGLADRGALLPPCAPRSTALNALRFPAVHNQAGVLQLLAQLTVVGDVTREAFTSRVSALAAGPEHVLVVEGACTGVPHTKGCY
jgi:hypothetical protein